MAATRNPIHEAIGILADINLESKSNEAMECRSQVIADLTILNGEIVSELEKQKARWRIARDVAKESRYERMMNKIKFVVWILSLTEEDYQRIITSTTAINDSSHHAQSGLEEELTRTIRQINPINASKNDYKLTRYNLIQSELANLKDNIQAHNSCSKKVCKLLVAICKGLLTLAKIILFGLTVGLAAVAVSAAIAATANPIGAAMVAVGGALSGVTAGVTAGVAAGGGTLFGGVLPGVTGGIAAIPAALGPTGVIAGWAGGGSMAAMGLYGFFTASDPMKEKVKKVEKSMQKFAEIRSR